MARRTIHVLLVVASLLIMTIYNPPASGYAPVQNYGIISISNYRDKTRIGILGAWYTLNPYIATFFRARVNSAQWDPVVALILMQIVVFAICTALGSSFQVWIGQHLTASSNNLAHGRVWTLITSTINHNGGLHIFFNLNVFSQVDVELCIYYSMCTF